MPIATRTFRVFVSSTFEDLKQERDALQREVFPKLRTLCEQHGARFQAIDLRWGVRDEAALDQQTMEICLREIRRCQATGVRPNFIVLLGDRYGWQPLPPKIPASEFDILLPHLHTEDAQSLARRWYWLDENAVPPEYCLQPRTGQFIPQHAWNHVEETLRPALAMAARAAGLPETDLIKYKSSATHQEILAGLGETEEDRRHVFAFFRRLGADSDERLEDLRRYLRERLPGNIEEYGAGEMSKLCDNVYSRLKEVIELEVKGLEDRPALDLEVEAHDRFAEECCRIFTGRETVLDTIEEYIRGTERRPLVLYGESGSGKSAVMAKASQQYNGPGRVIRRFIGASPESASGRALLTSLCRQIAPGDTPVDYAQLENAFKERLKVATPEKPLFLFIDALDQLGSSDPARDVTWLPPELPPHVKVFVSISATGTDKGERLPEGLPVHLERMAQSEGGQALDQLLPEARRALQPWQRKTVLAHFERCGLPLYLKLAAEESRLWKSYGHESECKLGEGISGVIDTLFDRLASNANHGPVLVERSLGYLAAARYGLTEDEVLDVLTEDDAVWRDFNERKRHEVSERRLPVVVWSRLSLDLEPYLTERAAPGGNVFTFYHRQLAERVEGRFLAGAALRAHHSDLARHFLAKPAWLDEARRTPNARRAVELVFQQRISQQWTEAEATLLDSQFLFAKVAAGMVLDLEADYQALLQEDPEMSLPRGEALRLIHGALRLSMHVASQDLAQFASQIVGRMLPHRDIRTTQHFIDEITAGAPTPWLRPLHPALHPPGTALVRTLFGHSGAVTGVSISEDGRRAVSSSEDKTLKVWDLETGREMRTLAGHSEWVRAVAVSADAQRVVSASQDKTLRVWDLNTGRELQIFTGDSGSVHSVAISADGRMAVSASSDRTLKVWDLETGLELKTLPFHCGPEDGVAVSPDGLRAVSSSGSKTVKVWDTKTGRVQWTLAGHFGWITGLAVSANGRRAVSASEDKTLRVWDLETGRQECTLTGHSREVKCVAVSADGRRAVSASMDRTLKVWDLETGGELLTLIENIERVYGVAVSRDGRRAVSACSDATLKVWDLETFQEPRTLTLPSHRVLGVAVSGDDRRAVSASGEQLTVWDLEMGRELSTMTCNPFFCDYGPMPATIYDLAVSSDGQLAVCACFDSTLRVWDLEAGSQLHTLTGHTESVNDVAMTGDGRRAVSASSDNTLKVWDLEAGREMRTLAGHSKWVLAVAVSADAQRVVSASMDNTLKVWDLETGGELLTLVGHSRIVTDVAVSADGRMAVSASYDGTLKVWDLETGRALLTLKGDSGFRRVAVTPDGKRAVSVGETLKVWDLEAGLLIATFQCDAPARCCAFTSDHRIVAGDESGRIHFLVLEE